MTIAYNFTAKITDAVGAVCSPSLSLNVSPGNRSDVGIFGFNYIGNAAYAGGSKFVIVLGMTTTDAPGFILWTGEGPNDPGWAGGPANVGDAVGVYTRVDNGPSNLLLPATVLLVLDGSGIKISSYTDGLMTTGSGNNSLATAWDGRFMDYHQNPTFHTFYWAILGSVSVPGN